MKLEELQAFLRWVKKLGHPVRRVAVAQGVSTGEFLGVHVESDDYSFAQGSQVVSPFSDEDELVTYFHDYKFGTMWCTRTKPSPLTHVRTRWLSDAEVEQILKGEPHDRSQAVGGAGEAAKRA